MLAIAPPPVDLGALRRDYHERDEEVVDLEEELDVLRYWVRPLHRVSRRECH